MRNDELRHREHDSQVNAPLEPLATQQQRGPWSVGQGQIVMGPSFYVWDESPKQAREWGVELANAWLARRR